MNNDEMGMKIHILALVVFSNLAMYRRGRDQLLNRLKVLNDVIESSMKEKEKGILLIPLNNEILVYSNY